MKIVGNAGFYQGHMDFTEHIHPCCELFYLKKGSIQLEIEGKKYILSKNSVHIIAPMERHCVTCLSDEYERYVIFMNPEQLEPIINNPVLTCVLKNRPANYNHVFSVSNQDIELIFKNCVKEYTDNSDCQFTNQQMASLMVTLLIMLYRSDPSRFTLYHGYSRLLDIQNYIEANYNKDMKISDLADKFYISQCYLTHSFKKYIGSSPKQYLIKTRLQHAQQLLLLTDKNITDIAEETGFDTVNDFSRKFKQTFGMSPTSYRKIQPNTFLY